MKVRHFCVVRAACAALAGALALTFGPAPARAHWKYEVCAQNMVRLQVVANSDLQSDQTVKLIVRDAVRSAARQILDGVEDSQSAFEALRAGGPALERAARNAARAAGFEGPVRVTVGESDFPDRVYAYSVVPAGRYRAVRVLLGEAAGRNWWCVIYPDLCVADEKTAQAIRDGKKIQFYSSIGKWLSGWFGGEESA